jgi:hypothetical protein
LNFNLVAKEAKREIRLNGDKIDEIAPLFAKNVAATGVCCPPGAPRAGIALNINTLDSGFPGCVITSFCAFFVTPAKTGVQNNL